MIENVVAFVAVVALEMTSRAFRRRKPMIPKLRPTADTWVARNEEGQLIAVKVVDMTDGHIRRWIRYFRNKVRNENPKQSAEWPNAAIDKMLIASMPTAPAIFAEATKRGLHVDNFAVSVLVDADAKLAPKETPLTKQQRAERLITLEDD